MNVLVYDGQIAGTTDHPDSLPPGFSCHVYNGDAPLSGLYFDGTNVLLVPPSPALGSVWLNNAWVKPPSNPVVVTSQPPASLTTNPLFPQLQAAITAISPVLAATLMGLLAKVEGNAALLASSEATLVSLLTAATPGSSGTTPGTSSSSTTTGG